MKFDYGIASVKELEIETVRTKRGQGLYNVKLKGEPLVATKRFSNSLARRFGISTDIFRYFSPKETFERIADKVIDSSFRYCIERNDGKHARLLGVTRPSAPLLQADAIHEVLTRNGGQDIQYVDGILKSTHTPRTESNAFHIGGDAFENRFVVEVPVDNYGRPSSFVSLLRLICSNGAIGYAPAFRSDINVGKKEQDMQYNLERAILAYNNADGFSAIRQRFEAAQSSWASLRDVCTIQRTLYKLADQDAFTLKGMEQVHINGEVVMRETCLPIFRKFNDVVHDPLGLYGVASIEAIGDKKQRALPVKCRVADILNFVTEIATHHATPNGNRVLNATISDMISKEFDLENTSESIPDFNDFFLGGKPSNAFLGTTLENN